MPSTLFAILTICTFINISGQDALSGLYKGKFNGDNVTLNLEVTGKKAIKGVIIILVSLRLIIIKRLKAFFGTPIQVKFISSYMKTISNK